MFFSKSNVNDKQSSEEAPCQLQPDEIMELLRPIKDPDIGVSIVELGLIYKIENKDSHIHVDITFTTPACPYGPQLLEEVRYTINAIEGVKSVDVNVVWDPPWSLDKISEATRLEMGLDL